jgi:hypothetical protein
MSRDDEDAPAPKSPSMGFSAKSMGFSAKSMGLSAKSMAFWKSKPLVVFVSDRLDVSEAEFEAHYRTRIEALRQMGRGSSSATLEGRSDQRGSVRCFSGEGRLVAAAGLGTRRMRSIIFRAGRGP